MNLVNNEIVELVFLGILRVLVSVHLKLASKFSSQFFVLLVYEGFFSFILFWGSRLFSLYLKN